MRTALLCVALLALVSIASLVPLAGPNGRITGKVVVAETKAPLAYANVILVGTNIGAMTLSDGSYTIDNVAPGTYTVRALMMGFKSVDQDSVVVLPGAEVSLVFAMDTTIVAKTQEIVVTSDQLEEMPVDDVLRTVSLKAGGVTAGDEMHVRGGRAQLGIYPQGKKLGGPWDFYRGRSEPWNTESYNRIYENEFLEVVANPLSTFSVDVDAASYSNVRRFVTQGALPPPDAVRIEELINYFRYDYPDPDGDHPFSITTEVADCPWNPEHRLVHVGLQGKRVPVGDLPPSNLVFLLDVSGSMNSPRKLPLLKASFRMLVENLREEDRVAIVVYAGAAGVVLPPTSGDQKSVILDSIDRLHAGGSTAGGQGIKLAYKIAQQNFLEDGNNRVILATDGDFNVGVSSDAEMIRLVEEKRESGVFLTVLGFGTGNIKDSKMEQIADKGNGHYAYIDGIREARKVMVSEMGASLLTIAKDVKIQVEFNPLRVESYRLIGYENRMLRKEDFDDDKKDAGEIGAGHSVTALYEVIPASGEPPVSEDLKYMQVVTRKDTEESDELLTVKFRYKRPNEDESQLITQSLRDEGINLEAASSNFRFSAAVAEFGMLLRESQFRGDATWDHVLEVARNATGEDAEGYRAEFIQLVETCHMMELSR